MAFILANIVVLTLAAWFFWWLSEYDSEITGENVKKDRIRRGTRCGITLLLVEAAFWGLWQCLEGNLYGGFLCIAVAVPFSIIWRNGLSQLAAQGFNWLIDPPDKREFDPRKNQRDLDAIASLIKHGHKDGAIQLCNELKESGDANVLAMETRLEHLGVPQDHLVQKPRPLAEASRLRLEGKFAEAETFLKSLLLENPANTDAAMMLIRLYAQELHDPGKAAEILRSLEHQPHVPAVHIEFARRSIPEWSLGKPAPEEVTVQPKSIDELLAQRHLGTAVEMLEQKIGEQPQDFDLWLKSVEVHAMHCGNVSRAEKIIRQIEINPAFNPEQIQLAKAKLKEWRVDAARRH